MKAVVEKKAKEEKLVALIPTVDKTDQAAAVDLPRLLQSELRRVGCNTGAVDGNWNAAAQKSLDLFNKHSGLKLDVRVASADALDAVKGKSSRICPLSCDHGIAVMSAREGLNFETDLRSDVAPLNHLIAAMMNAGEIHVLRDPTRGGLATTLNEIHFDAI